MPKISFIVKNREGDTLRIARPSTTMPTDTDELLRLVHSLARSRSDAFAHGAGFTYVFGDLAIGMDPPAEAHAQAFPYALGGDGEPPE